ncbi:hypothetical protein GOP47_0001881 [Adiantum capillus-veneris]|uniref:Uncharacterized protein n=1 Tax=Adiantum capillus-veneris TaxID=13818 RepID=A0A9D4V9J2_ADICA|nr:hypothetical protein GOP47_0001881 [Adiantum capillus-veneris]
MQGESHLASSGSVLRMEATNHNNQYSSISSGSFNAGMHNNNDKEEIDHAENSCSYEIEERITLSQRILIQLRNKDNYRRFASEILGTAMLMYFICGVSMTPNGNVSLMDHAISAALGIMVIIFMIPWMQVPIYIVGQVLGVILGTVISKSLYSTHATVVLSVPYQGVPISFIAEVLSAFLFMFLACSVSSNAQVTGLFASVAVAASIAINIVAGKVSLSSCLVKPQSFFYSECGCGFVNRPLSGGSMNPARSLAPAIVTGYVKNLWLYMVAPFIGASLGAGIHYLFTH